MSAQIEEATKRVLARPQGAGLATMLLTVFSSKGTDQSTVMYNKLVVTDGKEWVYELGTVQIL